MTALKAHEVTRFLARPDLRAGAYLVYGADAGLVRETAARLITHYAGPDPDPLAHSSFDVADLAEDPSKLAVEARTPSLFGGARTIRVRNADKNLAPILTELLAEPPEAIIVLEAGNLTPRDALRALAEKSNSARALPCYADNAKSLTDLVRTTLTDAGISYEADLVGFLVQSLGNDREITRRELEKLVLYAGDDKRLTIADAEKLTGDNSAQALDAIIDAVGTGRADRFDAAFRNALTAGIDTQRLLAIALNHFAALRRWRQAVTAGQPPKAVLDAARPRPHFSRRADLEQQLRLWSDTNLAAACERIAAAILESRQTGFSGPAIAERALLAICVSAARH